MKTISGKLRLTEGWSFPAYATDMCWLSTSTGGVSAIQIDGSFSFENAEDSPSKIQLRWGNPAGSPLTSWTIDSSDSLMLAWNGKVTLGGFIERSHLLEFEDVPLMVIELVGGAYPTAYTALPDLKTLQAGPFARTPDFDPAEYEYWYALLMPVESPLADFAHHALVNHMAVDCQAQLADNREKWHHVVGMPLVLNQITLLSSSV